MVPRKYHISLINFFFYNTIVRNGLSSFGTRNRATGGTSYVFRWITDFRVGVLCCVSHLFAAINQWLIKYFKTLKNIETILLHIFFFFLIQ